MANALKGIPCINIKYRIPLLMSVGCDNETVSRAYASFALKGLDMRTKCTIGDEQKIYDIGNIIYYHGKCHGFSDFYARIDKITPMSMDITILESEIDKLNSVVNFYLTDSKKKGLTRRPFYLLDYSILKNQDSRPEPIRENEIKSTNYPQSPFYNCVGIYKT